MGHTVMAMIAGLSPFGAWFRPEKERYNMEMMIEWSERQAAHLPYQKAEVKLWYLITSYKRHRYEQENLIDRFCGPDLGVPQVFFYHDDVWRPLLHDALMHLYAKFGGPLFRYNWTIGYF
ncbi:putative NADH dehydrogenase subunit NB6M [Trypanosoma rangeli]|uniref:Putative NADH dehydrogenase subunit NB6M n=1 Tax=Trypanosoma rangeli TaxID=5698 RepID=A0A3R7MHX5_TRYRA|nr:putative NADH dehydrogenase subunit NB6M [Trypanosoma rangeli]RNF02804.1 putative NADH dehydrogenase subunit NB6M [Trypanosoma rangeli]|eukprot:RNF02804.1 putative NADH dehydrogenase subunit NB6M [Trypanosoma rangeli]